MKNAQPRDEFIRKREERKRRKRKRRLIFFFIFLIFVLIAVGITLSLTVFFPIDTINSSGSEIYTPEQISSATGINYGDNLFVISKTEITEKLRETLPYIEEVKIKRKLPGTLNITVSDADEFACYYIDGKYFAVSESGHVLNSYDTVPPNVFEVRCGDVKCNVGEQIEFSSENTKNLVNNILTAFKTKDININYIDVTDNVAIQAKVEGRFIVNFGTSNFIEHKTAHLSGMLKNMPADKTGKINLSMWSESNTEGTFVEGSIE